MSLWTKVDFPAPAIPIVMIVIGFFFSDPSAAPADVVADDEDASIVGSRDEKSPGSDQGRLPEFVSGETVGKRSVISSLCSTHLVLVNNVHLLSSTSQPPLDHQPPPCPWNSGTSSPPRPFGPWYRYLTMTTNRRKRFSQSAAYLDESKMRPATSEANPTGRSGPIPGYPVGSMFSTRCVWAFPLCQFAFIDSISGHLPLNIC